LYARTSSIQVGDFLPLLPSKLPLPGTLEEPGNYNVFTTLDDAGILLLLLLEWFLICGEGFSEFYFYV